MNESPGDPIVAGSKQRISIHVDGGTYRILLAYAAAKGDATPNHAAFRLVVSGIKQLCEQYEWAANIRNEERLKALEQQ